MISKVKESNAWLKYKLILKILEIQFSKRNAKLNSSTFADKSTKPKWR